MTNTANSNPLPSAVGRRSLPTTLEDWQSQYKLKTAQSLNNAVEQVVRSVLADMPDGEDAQRFLTLIDATRDDESITGKITYDDYEAARIIIERATHAGVVQITVEKPAAIVRALRTVLRRFNASRESRRGED